MKKTLIYFGSIIALLICNIHGCHRVRTVTTIAVFPDSVLSDVSHHPIGINLDYFMDDDQYLRPARSTADALKAMGVRYLRYPGGNKSDFYFFSRPPWEHSEPTLARTGRGAVGGRDRVLKNYSEFAVDVLDFDEFMILCRETGAEPVLCVAADEYMVDYPEGCTWASREELIEHAVEWVRYANIKKGYGVKYWLIGNESWHRQNVNSTAEIYARDVVDFSMAMKAVDPSIYIVPNGNSVEFWEKVITIAGDHVDLLCFSNYPVYEYKAGYATYRDTLQDLMHPVRRAQSAIAQFATPAQKARWKLINAEYGPFDWGDYWPKISNLGMTLATFEMTGCQLNEPDLLFSCFWNTRWINNDSVDHSAFDALDRNGNFNAIGKGLAIWGNHLGDNMVKATGTTHLRSFASYTAGDHRLFVYLIHTAPETRLVELKIALPGNPEVVMARELVGEGPDDVDPVWQECEPFRFPTRFRVKGTSITVIEYQIH